ncbi:c-type cytochrome [Teredinibacter franksiae]|uniref:c-type cytochrome n=1 Tax=Teredinibacter franksiae TaxID=2761453 RepID=UPI001626ED4F|nr:c-type cytochrome [Teredinibacter franksiae]
MKNLVCTTLMSLSLLAAAGYVNAAGDAAKGEKLVAACGACHGADGNSALAAFPKLAGLGEKYLLNQMIAIKNKSRNIAEMAGQLDALSEQDLANIAAFYSSKPMQLSGSKEQQVQLNSGLKVDGLALGAKVFRGGNHESGVPACTGCHSPTGLGNAPAGYPRLSGQHADYIAKQLREFRAGNRTTDGDSMVMRGVTQYMSDAEIDAVANFIAGLN